MNKNLKSASFEYRYLLGRVVRVACRYRHVTENLYNLVNYILTELIVELLSYFHNYLTSSNSFQFPHTYVGSVWR